MVNIRLSLEFLNALLDVYPVHRTPEVTEMLRKARKTLDELEGLR